MNLLTILGIGAAGLYIFNKASEAAASSSGAAKYSASLYNANMSDAELLALWSNSPGIDNVFGKRYYDAAGNLYRYQGNAYWSDLSGQWFMATPSQVVTPIDFPPWLSTSAGAAAGGGVTTGNGSAGRSTVTAAEKIPEINYAPAVEPGINADPENILIPEDISPFQKAGLVETVDLMVARGATESEIQKGIDNRVSIIYSGGWENYKPALAVAYTPDNRQIFLYTGDSVPLNATYLDTNPEGLLPWIDDSTPGLTIYFQAAMQNYNPPNVKQILSDLGLKV